jgi:hypothetical protein
MPLFNPTVIVGGSGLPGQVILSTGGIPTWASLINLNGFAVSPLPARVNGTLVPQYSVGVNGVSL